MNTIKTEMKNKKRMKKKNEANLFNLMFSL